MSETLDWAEDDPKMIELADQTVIPKPCICGKHIFSVDEINMGSLCSQCYATSDGIPFTNIAMRREQRENE